MIYTVPVCDTFFILIRWAMPTFLSLTVFPCYCVCCSFIITKAPFQYNNRLSVIRISTIKMWRSWDRLIFVMGIRKLVKCTFILIRLSEALLQTWINFIPAWIQNYISIIMGGTKWFTHSKTAMMQPATLSTKTVQHIYQTINIPYLYKTDLMRITSPYISVNVCLCDKIVYCTMCNIYE